MKKLLLAALCMLCAISMVAQPKVVKSAAKLAGKVDKIEEARELINQAISNPETANDPNTYFTAGMIEWKSFDKLRAPMMLTGNNDITPEMAEMMLRGYNYFAKALGMNPDPKMEKQIRSEISGHEWDMYLSGLQKYNAKEFYPGAYEGFYYAADIPVSTGMQGSQQIPDSTRGVAYYYAGLAANAGNQLDKALDAFNKAVALDVKEPNAFIGQIACWENIAKQDSTLAPKAHQEAMNISKNAYAHFGMQNPWFLSKIIDLYVGANEFQPALDFLSGEMQKYPNNAYLTNLRGWVKGRMGDDEGYVKDYMAAAEMPDATASILVDAANAMCRWAQAVNGQLRGEAGDKAVQTELVNTYLIPAQNYINKAKGMNPDASLQNKINRVSGDIDYQLELMQK